MDIKLQIWQISQDLQAIWMWLGLNFGVLRAQNFEDHGDMDYGFEEVYIDNAPEGFVSISEDEVKGYLFHKDFLKNNVRFGNGTIYGDTVTFDLDDVLVYDKNGTVYYAKGYYNDGELFYNATVHKKLVEF